MSHTSLPVTRCPCGQTIGDVSVHYQNLINGGTDHREAVELLGINKMCCLVSIQSHTTYPLKRARIGTTSIQPDIDSRSLEHNKKVYRLEGGSFRMDGPSSNLSEVKTAAFVTKARVIPPKKETPESTPAKKLAQIVRSNPLTQLEQAKENAARGPVDGLQEIIPDVGIDSLDRGMVVPFGWVRDADDNVVLIGVGEGYQVPIYKICFSVAS